MANSEIRRNSEARNPNPAQGSFASLFPSSSFVPPCGISGFAIRISDLISHHLRFVMANISETFFITRQAQGQIFITTAAKLEAAPQCQLMEFSYHANHSDRGWWTFAVHQYKYG